MVTAEIITFTFVTKSFTAVYFFLFMSARHPGGIRCHYTTCISLLCDCFFLILGDMGCGLTPKTNELDFLVAVWIWIQAWYVVFCIQVIIRMQDFYRIFFAKANFWWPRRVTTNQRWDYNVTDIDVICLAKLLGFLWVKCFVLVISVCSHGVMKVWTFGRIWLDSSSSCICWSMTMSFHSQCWTAVSLTSSSPPLVSAATRSHCLVV